MRAQRRQVLARAVVRHEPQRQAVVGAGAATVRFDAPVERQRRAAVGVDEDDRRHGNRCVRRCRHGCLRGWARDRARPSERNDQKPTRCQKMAPATKPRPPQSERDAQPPRRVGTARRARVARRAARRQRRLASETIRAARISPTPVFGSNHTRKACGRVACGARRRQGETCGSGSFSTVMHGVLQHLDARLEAGRGFR